MACHLSRPAVCLLFALSAACTSTSVTAIDPREAEVGQMAAATLGPGGGSLATASGSAKLALPPGALDANATLSVTVRSALLAPHPEVLGSAVYDLGPSGTSFAQPVVLALKEVSAAPAGQRSVLATLDVNDANQVWQVLAQSVAANGVVSAPIAHLSLYAVLRIPQSGAGCAAQSDPNAFCSPGLVCVNDRCGTPPADVSVPPPSTFSVGGSISGLTGTVVLENVLDNHGSDALTLDANAQSFTFPTPLANNANYAVQVRTQPSGQVCSVAQGSGQVHGAAVTQVQVTCAAPFLLSVQLAAAAGTSLVAGNTLQLSAAGVYSDDSQACVTAQTTWTSSDATVATVSSTGAVMGVAAGHVFITGSVDGLSSRISLTVTSAHLTGITPQRRRHQPAAGRERGLCGHRPVRQWQPPRHHPAGDLEQRRRQRGACRRRRLGDRRGRRQRPYRGHPGHSVGQLGHQRDRGGAAVHCAQQLARAKHCRGHRHLPHGHGALQRRPRF